jgi:hypothetical protein
VVIAGVWRPARGAASSALGGVQGADLGRDIGEATVNGGDEFGDVWHAPRVRKTRAAGVLRNQNGATPTRSLPTVAANERRLALLFAVTLAQFEGPEPAICVCSAGACAPAPWLSWTTPGSRLRDWNVAKLKHTSTTPSEGKK